MKTPNVASVELSTKCSHKGVAVESENIRPIPDCGAKDLYLTLGRYRFGDDEVWITSDGAVHIGIGGSVVVRTARAWHALASPPIPAASAPKGAEPPMAHAHDWRRIGLAHGPLQQWICRTCGLDATSEEEPEEKIIVFHGAEPTTIALQYAIEAWQRDESERVKYGGLQVPSHAEAASLLGRCRNYFGDLPRASPTTGVDPGAETLLPCPFCGEAPYLNEYEDNGRAQIGCDNNKCPVDVHTRYEKGVGHDLAVAQWNRRASFDTDIHDERRPPAPLPSVDLKTDPALLARMSSAARASPPTRGEADLLREIPRWLLSWDTDDEGKPFKRMVRDDACGNWVEYADCRASIAANASLRAKLAERDADAERYRWIRDSADLPLLRQLLLLADKPYRQFDAAIDAASQSAQCAQAAEWGKT